jgi:malonyl CoA-acyl carrier protein transacylase
VEAAQFAPPVFDVISNVDAQPYRDVATIKKNLVRSVVDEVRWHDASERLLAYELDLVVEFGASAVLSALMRRMRSAPPIMVVSDYAGVKELSAAIGAGV